MRNKVFRYAWFISLFVAVTLSCNLVSGLQERVRGVENTARSAATGIQSGEDLLATGRALVTQAEGSPLLKTAQAVATEQGPRLVETAQAFATEQGPSLAATAKTIATEQGPSLVETASAYATEQGPGLIETARAYATEQGPGLLETAQAVATQASASIGKTPADIPLIETGRTNLFISTGLISYTTSQDLKNVQEFYESEMPANGWTKVEDQSVVSGKVAILTYQKETRKATISLSISPLDNHTIVLITIQEK